MKKSIFTVLIAMLSIGFIQAQFDMEKLYVGGNLGYAKPIGDFSEYAKGGLTYNLFAGYHLTDNFSVGLERAAALTFAIDSENGTGFLGLNIFGLEGYFAKATYKFMDGSFKPYAGLGLGLGRFSEPDIDDVIEGASRNYFAGKADLGFAIGSWDFSYSFVYNGKTAKEPVFNQHLIDENILYHKFSIGYIYQF